MPGNLAVGEFHKDSDYNHQRSEITYWLPFTPAFSTNTIWIESEEDKKDYQPYSLDYGQVLVFHSSILSHGNMINETGQSRVSMDFRVIPFSKYSELETGSSNLNLKFKIGSYYSLME
jgi:ectoine hydroxylase-related dioxygenase (phytanoyl-CoA dioxygenase family)